MRPTGPGMKILNRLAIGLLSVPAFACAQSAGDNVVSLGWLHIMTQDSSSPITTNVAPTPINGPLSLPSSFTSPGTGLSVDNADTLGFTFSHFFTDHLAVTMVGGIPPAYTVSAHGTITPPGPAGALGGQDVGLPSVNPVVTSVREWSPALIFQYYFADANAKLRPFAGIGVSYNWYTDLQLNKNFVTQTQTGLGAILAAGAGKPGTVQVSADASSSWQPVFNAGLTYQFTAHWGMVASLTYMPLKTTSTVTIKAADGTKLGQTQSDLKVNPFVTYLAVSYKF
jgi:outer membrane protein